LRLQLQMDPLPTLGGNAATGINVRSPLPPLHSPSQRRDSNHEWLELDMLPGSRGASPYGLAGFNLDDAAATLPISQQAEQPAVQPDGLIASAAADAAAGAVAAAQARIAEMSARPQESTRAAPTKAESAVPAAATAAAQPLHFVSYRLVSCD
jgi:hypothetical protein